MAKNKKIKSGPLFRTIVLERQAVNEESRTIELSCSSELPVERWWGMEILDHSTGAVRMDRMKACGPLLMDHNTRDQVGVVESCQIKDRKLTCTVRFGKGTRAEEIFQDVLDGIRSNVSIGYLIHKMKGESEEETDGKGRVTKAAVYRAVDWEPYEVSIVSVPADTSVGVGRAENSEEREIEVETLFKEERTMKCKCGKDLVAGVVCDCGHRELPQGAPAGTSNGRNEAMAEVREILAIAGRRPEVLMADAQQFIQAGRSLEEFRGHVMEKLFKAQPVAVSAEIGLTDKEARSFSFLRAINALANPGDPRFREAAAFELECSTAVAKRLQRSPQGIFIPFEVQNKRDLVKGTPNAGGYTVQTDVLGDSFIEVLRNRLCLQMCGATYLGGLVGDIAIPSQSGAATAYWVGENTGPTESQQVLGQVPLVPKTLGAFTDVGRRLLLQSSIDVEAMVRRDLAAVMALEIDRVGIAGSGSGNEPRGILNTAGIGSVVGGTNGLAPTYEHMVDLETAVAFANADFGSIGYCTNTKVRGRLKKTQKFATTNGDPVWEKGDGTPGIGEVNGYRALASNQVPSNLTKGTSNGIASAILFGNFADLIIATWGGLDLLVDPYTGSAAGTVRVRVLQEVDVALRRIQSFAAMVDALA